MTDRAEELAPCPFCGGAAERITIGDYDPNNVGGDVIACNRCGASSHVEFGFKENLVSSWNRRVSTPWNSDMSAAPRDGTEAKLDEDGYLWKWVERGLFDPAISPTEALNVIAHHPAAPWKRTRWDVDHKPYASAFYGKFPGAAVPRR